MTYDGASISPRSAIGTGPAGQRAHQSLINHTERLERCFYELRDRVWCYVGNGLSNQTFVEGPEGVIAIDTGECKEEKWCVKVRPPIRLQSCFC